MLRSTYITAQTVIATCAAVGCTSLGVLLGLLHVRSLAVTVCGAGLLTAAVAIWSAAADVLFERRRKRDSARHLETTLSELVRMALGEAATTLSGETTIDATGRQYRHHPEGLCAGQWCAIHHPSDHHMREWATVFRADRMPLVERICPHGVGHPDPDSLTYLAVIDPDNRGAWDVHGCDGCCRPPEALLPPMLEDPDTNGRGARLATIRSVLTEAAAVAEGNDVLDRWDKALGDLADLETTTLERCVICDVPIIDDDYGRVFHVMEPPLPPRQACPPDRVPGHAVTVATPPS